MATYNFSTITAAQALAVGAGDTLVLDGAPANQTSVLFVPGVSGAQDRFTVVAGERSAVFGDGLIDVVKTTAGGAVLIVGTNGPDGPLFGGPGDDGLYGGPGDDALAGANGADLLQGNQGRDTLSGQAGDDVIYGGQDNDLLTGGSAVGGFVTPGYNFVQGNKGDDTVTGGSDDHDILLGGQGNDLIGATSLVAGGPFGWMPASGGGNGSDVMNGNLGDDIVIGGFGNDTLLGEDGNDALVDFGGGSRNLIDGGAGNDTLGAQNGSATLNGGAGNDLVAYLNGTYVISLGDGDDSCTAVAEQATDRVTVDGGAGNDIIDGSNGSDSITGGAGSDTIDGYAGADTVAGGGGSDQFQFYLGEAGVLASALDVILDWAADDRFFFAGETINDPVGAGTPGTYLEATASSYAAALSFANSQIALGVLNYIAVQVAGDVYVFADTAYDAGTADSAVRLVGRSLADISFMNFEATTDAVG